MNISLWHDSKEFRLSLIERIDSRILVSIGKKKHNVSVEFLSSDEAILNIDGKFYDVLINSNSRSYFVYVNGKCFHIEKKSASHLLGEKPEKQRKRDIKTSMPGRIVKVLAQEGDKVKEGQAVLILEAMKMQNEIKSPQSGRITKIYPQAGDSMEAGSLLFTVE